MKSNKKTVTILASILILLILVVIVLFFRTQNEKTKENNVENKDVEVVSTIEKQISEEDAFVINTDYCDLYYPLKWEESVYTEIVTSEVYTVQFYGKLENKEDQHLFDIIFGNADGTLLGKVENDGEKIPVYLKGIEFEADDSWSEEEKITIMTMQEDVNYVIGMLQKEAGFKAE